MFKENPEKTSNIWHLVCLNPWKDVQKAAGTEISDDYTLLERRMEHFLGLHYEDDLIENGIHRLPIISSPKSLILGLFSLNFYLKTRAKSAEQSLYHVLNS